MTRIFFASFNWYLSSLLLSQLMPKFVKYIFSITRPILTVIKIDIQVALKENLQLKL